MPVEDGNQVAFGHMKKAKIAYFCDGKLPCSGKVGCYLSGLPGMDNCRHTFDASHALRGPCDDPENHPERFNRLDIRDESETAYWEGEILIDKLLQ